MDAELISYQVSTTAPPARNNNNYSQSGPTWGPVCIAAIVILVFVFIFIFWHCSTKNRTSDLDDDKTACCKRGRKGRTGKTGATGATGAPGPAGVTNVQPPADLNVQTYQHYQASAEPGTGIADTYPLDTISYASPATWTLASNVITLIKAAAAGVYKIEVNIVGYPAHNCNQSDIPIGWFYIRQNSTQLSTTG